MVDGDGEVAERLDGVVAGARRAPDDPVADPLGLATAFTEPERLEADLVAALADRGPGQHEVVGARARGRGDRDGIADDDVAPPEERRKRLRLGSAAGEPAGAGAAGSTRTVPTVVTPRS